MPFYHYFCEANKKTVEVSHRMSERLQTWGEVCKYAAIDPGDIPLNFPVVRLISKPLVRDWRLKGLDKDAPSDKLSL